MGDVDKKIIEDLKRRLPPEVLGHIRQMIMFGSRARGDAAEDSDLDLLAVVDEKTPELEQALDDAAYSVMWDFDFRPTISLKVIPERRFQRGIAAGFSFYRNVVREGIRV
ncbi:nucleotidyltransferase domain-containing protein [Geobacter sp. DSM 9736]|uniref:nucleotidyltransferase domain-containing protein n=1 Tax=Geobacter sp. DSM 9736 TaxID=1277350 RepID=UPI000B50CACA|nr:nucleotidyltransferase domain-containing protein [Geobacter sp. DSM 9736]SNB47991.1 Nucleotidyltransferase domain-containing protein [Geobacter sp. DSM 9736]